MNMLTADMTRQRLVQNFKARLIDGSLLIVFAAGWVLALALNGLYRPRSRWAPVGPRSLLVSSCSPWAMPPEMRSRSPHRSLKTMRSWALAGIGRVKKTPSR